MRNKKPVDPFYCGHFRDGYQSDKIPLKAKDSGGFFLYFTIDCNVRNVGMKLNHLRFY